MKTLNFFPYYEALLRKRNKCTTIRLGDQRSKYAAGDRAIITIGWTENEANLRLQQIEIAEVCFKRIRDITIEDLNGESPDCTQKEAVPFVLSAIYRKTVSAEDYVTIIKWKYIN
ncbi:MAG: hypothetical protein NWE94_05190 [Candidatus Bathyarchaeota archaeon]|nr:hypothetical protein [Candidatus Bathyarchaeota archaeon]